MGRLDVRICGARDIHKPRDTYVKLAAEFHGFKTQIVNRSANPEFDEVFKFQIRDTDSSQLHLQLWESNTLSDRELGHYRLSLAGLNQQELWDQSVLLQDQPSNEGRIELRVRVCAVDFGGRPSSNAVSPPPQQGGQAYGAAPSYPQAGGYGPPPPPPQAGGYGPPPQPGHQHHPPHYLQQPSGYGPPPPPQQHQQQQQHGYPQHHQHQHQQYPPPPPPQQQGFAGGVAGPAPGHHQHQGPPPAPLGGFAPPPNMDMTRFGILPPPRVAAAGRRPDQIPEWEKLGMSQLEYDHLVAVFVRFDTNDSNSLSKTEMSELLRWLNYATTDQSVDRVFTDMNRSGGGDSITQDEFCRWLAFNRPDPQALYGLPQVEYNQVLAQFRACDRARSGRVSPDEFFHFCRANGWASDHQQAKHLFSEVDVTRSGFITLDEFLKWRGTKGRHLRVSMSSGSFEPAVEEASHLPASGIVDPNIERETKTQRVLSFMPHLTREQAVALLRRLDWDTNQAVEAALDGKTS